MFKFIIILFFFLFFVSIERVVVVSDGTAVRGEEVGSCGDVAVEMIKSITTTITMREKLFPLLILFFFCCCCCLFFAVAIVTRSCCRAGCHCNTAFD